MNCLLPLGGSRWSVWRDGLPYSAGFPVAGFDQFAGRGYISQPRRRASDPSTCHSYGEPT